MPVYTFSLKSGEQEGATKPNIIRIGLANDADAETFKANLEAIFAADVVTVNVVLSSDYTLPYPDGTPQLARCAMWDDTSQTEQLTVKSLIHDFAPIAFGESLVAAGILMGPNGDDHPAVQVNPYVITPGQFR